MKNRQKHFYLKGGLLAIAVAITTGVFVVTSSAQVVKIPSVSWFEVSPTQPKVVGTTAVFDVSCRVVPGSNGVADPSACGGCYQLELWDQNQQELSGTATFKDSGLPVTKKCSPDAQLTVKFSKSELSESPLLRVKRADGTVAGSAAFELR